MFSLVPCNHYWLAVRYHNGEVAAICKHMGCRQLCVFSDEEWQLAKDNGTALDKPKRV